MQSTVAFEAHFLGRAKEALKDETRRRKGNCKAFANRIEAGQIRWKEVISAPNFRKLARVSQTTEVRGPGSYPGISGQWSISTIT